jgi:hypothetical protein
MRVCSDFAADIDRHRRSACATTETLENCRADANQLAVAPPSPPTKRRLVAARLHVANVWRATRAALDLARPCLPQRTKRARWTISLPGVVRQDTRSSALEDLVVHRRFDAPPEGASAPPTTRSVYGWLPGPPWLWQDAGRSFCGPVHCPLWPAPLPPLVGGLGEAQAEGTSPTQITPAASSVAVVLRIRGKSSYLQW